MSAPNWSQVSGVADRLVLVVLTFVASKGWITPADVTNLATLAIGILGAIYAYYVNRNTNLAKQASNIPGTIVVTNDKIAAATPNQENIVSSADVKVTKT